MAELKYLHSTAKLGTDWIESRRVPENTRGQHLKQVSSASLQDSVVLLTVFPLNLIRHQPPMLDQTLNVRCLQIRASTSEQITWCPPPFLQTLKGALLGKNSSHLNQISKIQISTLPVSSTTSKYISELLIYIYSLMKELIGLNDVDISNKVR